MTIFENTVRQLKSLRFYLHIRCASVMVSIWPFCNGPYALAQSANDNLIPEKSRYSLVILDPAHPHGVSMQLSLQKAFNPKVYVYAPQGPEIEENYLKAIRRYNAHKTTIQPWELDVYTNTDYLDKMLEDRKGSVVIIASNNQKKSMYIEQSVKSGLNVIADKPMAITQTDFERLKTSFEIAERDKLFISDLRSMSMRYQITSILQKEFASLPEIFGVLERGSLENPAVIQKSVHHYLKNNTRPAWFFDGTQQGNAIVDVGTHLVDLVQWSCFPTAAIFYENDVEILSAKTWPTTISRSQFKRATKQNDFPSFLEKDMKDSVLYVDANGEMNYTLKGIHVRITVSWDFQASKGGDTYYSLMRGSKANLIVANDGGSQPVLLIEPYNIANRDHYKKLLKHHFERLKEKYATIELTESETGWRITSKKRAIEKTNYIVKPTKKEVNNMLAKYYTTTQAITEARH